jgi:hypothetical protein
VRPKLAILIPTIDGREPLFEAVWTELTRQRQALAQPDDVVILVNKDNQAKTIGEKRNELMDAALAAGASHQAFVDDDDMVSPRYLDLNMPGVYGDFDCNSLHGCYYVDGVYDRPFHHSLRYTHWWHDAAGYYRNPNHLNVVKIERIKHLRFHDTSAAEDRCFSDEIARGGLLRTELAVDEPVYHYYYRTKPAHEIARPARQRRPGS